MLERNVSRRKSQAPNRAATKTAIDASGPRPNTTSTRRAAPNAPAALAMHRSRTTAGEDGSGMEITNPSRPIPRLKRNSGNALVRNSRLLGEATARTPTTAPKQAAMTEMGTATISLSTRAAV